MPREKSIKGNKMDIKDFGKTAICGVSGTEVTISKYNYKCPCLNCIGCNDEEKPNKCGWRHVLETNPCTNEDMREILCVNCQKEQR